MRFAIAFLSSVALAYAQSLTVNTPISPISCVNQQVTFTGGTAPYILQVNSFPPANGQSPLNTYSGISGSPFTWLVEQPAGTNVFLRLRDSSGLTAESGQVSIVSGGPATCSASSSAGGTASTPAGTTQSSAAPPPASSTAGGVTSAAPTGSSGGSTTSTRATSASSSSTPNAGSAVKVAGASVVGFAGLVAAVLA